LDSGVAIHLWQADTTPPASECAICCGGPKDDPKLVAATLFGVSRVL